MTLYQGEPRVNLGLDLKIVLATVKIAAFLLGPCI